MDQIPPRVSMPTVSMGGSYPPNVAPVGLPPWTSSRGEDYAEGLRHRGALYAAQQTMHMPAMIQHSGEPRYPSHPDPTVMTTSRKKSRATKTQKQKSQISSDNARTSVIHSQGDATTVPMMNYNIPSSSSFMMAGTMSHQPITTMHNPSYLPPLPPSSMPQDIDHSQMVSARLATQHPTQQLSHLTHSPLVVGIATSIATSVALTMPAPTQLLPLTTQGWEGHSGCSGLNNTNPWPPSAAVNCATSTVFNKSSSEEFGCPPTPASAILGHILSVPDADWDEIVDHDQSTTTDNTGSTSGHNIAKKVQAAQHVPPVSQGGVLSSNSHNIACSTSYCPQQVEQTTQNQKVVAPAFTQELEQIQTAQQLQGVGVLSPQSNILASTNQAPPPVAGKSPLPCLNISEGHSSPITTLNHHRPDTNSSINHGSSSSVKATVGVPTTQGYATSNSNIVTQKSDQLPVCASPIHNQANQSDQSDDDDCHTDSCCKPAQVGYSPINPIDPEFIEKIESDLSDKDWKLFRQYFHRKRKLTAVLESENENKSTCTCKNARKDSAGGDDFLVPFVLLMKGQRDLAKELRNLKDGQNDIIEELRDIKEIMNEQLQTLSGPSQQVKMERAVKTETQDNCMPIYALKEESNGIRLEDCCWPTKDENLLKMKGDDPRQYALKLLEKLFPVEDRVEKCYRRGPRTPNKPLLDQQRVKILENCIKYRFGLKQFLACESDFGERINQKCRDAKRKSIKKE